MREKGEGIKQKLKRREKKGEREKKKKGKTTTLYPTKYQPSGLAKYNSQQTHNTNN